MAGSTDFPLSALCGEAARLGREIPGLRLVVLFGSVPRGQALPASDVDIGILGAGFWEGLTIGANLGRLCGREPHVVELDRASDLLRHEIARDGVPLYQGIPDAWPLFRADAIVRFLDFKPTFDLCVSGARKRVLVEARRG